MTLLNDPEVVITGLLTTNWDSDNTDDVTPTIGEEIDYKRVSFDDNESFVLVSILNPMIELANGSGTESKEVDTAVNIRIMTNKSKSHSRKLLEEVKRILEDNMINPDTDYTHLIPDSNSIQNLSNKMRSTWGYSYPIRLLNTNTVRGTQP